MSYAQAMRWHKKHPRGIRNLYLGFDSSSPTKKKTEQEIRDFYPEYLAYHKKHGTPEKEIMTLDEYIKERI